MPNRADRRKAQRAAERLTRHGQIESAGVTASCAWEDCGDLVVVNAPDIHVASARMREHYDEKHGGESP
jgi:hypothetical protein